MDFSNRTDDGFEIIPKYDQKDKAKYPIKIYGFKKPLVNIKDEDRMRHFYAMAPKQFSGEYYLAMEQLFLRLICSLLKNWGRSSFSNFNCESFAIIYDLAWHINKLLENFFRSTFFKSS